MDPRSIAGSMHLPDRDRVFLMLSCVAAAIGLMLGLLDFGKLNNAPSKAVSGLFPHTTPMLGTAMLHGSDLAVMTWKDKSGNGNALTDVANQPPLLHSAALNGKNTVQMASFGQELATSSNIGVSGGADRTLITVQYNNVINTGTDAAGEAFGIDIQNAANMTLPYQYANDNSITSNSALLNAWNINVGERSSGSTYGYANGAKVGRTVTNRINTVPQSLTLGTRTPGDGQQRTGQFAEILYYGRALSRTKRQELEGYLACKWGLQSSLPSSHPYRSSCPPVRFAPTSLSNLVVWYDASDASTITTVTNAR